jgi:hypothetical protein
MAVACHCRRYGHLLPRHHPATRLRPLANAQLLATSGISKPRLWDDVREGALYICPGYLFASLGLIWVLFCMPQLFNPYLLRVEDSR